MSCSMKIQQQNLLTNTLDTTQSNKVQQEIAKAIIYSWTLFCFRHLVLNSLILNLIQTEYTTKLSFMNHMHCFHDTVDPG